MLPRETFPTENEHTPLNTHEFNEPYDDLNFSDGMDPITFPNTLTFENFKQVLGETLPEGIDPKLFEEGGTMSLSE